MYVQKWDFPPNNSLYIQKQKEKFDGGKKWEMTLYSWTEGVIKRGAREQNPTEIARTKLTYQS